jgi:hypothetical protein
MGNDHGSFLQELVGNANAFAQEAAGILPQIQDQAFHVAEFVERGLHLIFGGLGEAGDMHVADTRLDEEVRVHAVAGNLVTGDGELKWFVSTFARDGDANGGILRPFEEISDLAGIHVVSGLAVDGDDHVTRANASTISRRSGERSDHYDFVVTRTHLHANPVILAALVLAKLRVLFGVEEIGVWIQHVQHAGDGAVINGFVRVHRVSVILFHDGVDIRERFEIVFGLAGGKISRGALSEYSAGESGCDNDKNNGKKGAARTAVGHRFRFLLDNQILLRSIARK